MRAPSRARAHEGSPPDAPPPPAGGGRHTAIAAHLTKWSDYETWARQVRDAWQQETAAAAAGESPEIPAD